MASKSNHVKNRIYNISVIGVSGTENEKGSCGVGKSCLINRFVRQNADDYFTDHISVVSQSDFGGRVINNDHFLYWGEVIKNPPTGFLFSDENSYLSECTFRIVEQTEFVDDSSFMPFRSNKTEIYAKRCVDIKLQSAEKLAYICKNQLGLEHEFDQNYLPNGNLYVDGFICVFDVSRVMNRSIEIQITQFLGILLNVIKTKKPFLIVTTKNDLQFKGYFSELEKGLNKKEFKDKCIIIETSAHENVNVDAAFFTLAALAEKSFNKSRLKSLHYLDAKKIVDENNKNAKEEYLNLLRMSISNYKAMWIPSQHQFRQKPEFQKFVSIFGIQEANKYFKYHLSSLRNELIQSKQVIFLERLKRLIKEKFPDLNSIAERSWYSIMKWFNEQQDFINLFFVMEVNKIWKEDDYILDSDDEKIPFDFLASPEAENVFRDHLNLLCAEQKRFDLKRQFREMLQESQHILPGRSLTDVTIYFLGKECFVALSEVDKQEVYQDHQRSLKEKARKDFHELLLENSKLFTQFENMQVTNDHILAIKERLKDEQRYKNLGILDDERRAILLNHLGFVQHPSRDRCPAHNMCIDIQSDSFLQFKKYLQLNEMKLVFVIIGPQILTDQFFQEIQTKKSYSKIQIDETIYNINFMIEVIDVLRFNIFDYSNLYDGCFLLFNCIDSLNSISQLLDASFIDKLKLIFVLGFNDNISEDTLSDLREEGQVLATRYSSLFIDIPSSLMLRPGIFFHSDQVDLAIVQLLQTFHNSYTLINSTISLPTTKIALCMVCSDTYDVAELINLFAKNLPNSKIIDSSISSLKSFFLQISNDNPVEIIPVSYHTISTLSRNYVIHGFFLIYSVLRKASLSILKSFVSQVPYTPIQIVALSDGNNSKKADFLLSDGQSFAKKFCHEFLSIQFGLNTDLNISLNCFLNHCIEKRVQTEKNFYFLKEISHRSIYDRNSSRSSFAPLKYKQSPSLLQCINSSNKLFIPSKPMQNKFATLSIDYGSNNGRVSKSTNIQRQESEQLYSEIPWDINDSSNLISSMQTLSLNEDADNHKKSKKLKQSFAKSTSVSPASIHSIKINNDYSLVNDHLISSEEHTYASIENSYSKLPYRKFQVNHMISPRKIINSNSDDSDFGSSDYILMPDKDNSFRKLKSRSCDDSLSAIIPLNNEENDDITNSQEINESSSGEKLFTGRSISQNRIGKIKNINRKESKFSGGFSDDDVLSRKQKRRASEQILVPKLSWKKRFSRKKREHETNKVDKKDIEESVSININMLIISPVTHVPIFLEKCIQYIESNDGLNTKGIYRLAGIQSESKSLLNACLKNPYHDLLHLKQSIHDVTASVRMFFRRLTEPLISDKLCSQLIQAKSHKDSTTYLNVIKEIIQQLSNLNHNILTFIVLHLHKISKNSIINQMDSKNLAICWWPSLMRPTIESIDQLIIVSAPLQDVLAYLIDNAEYFF